MAEVTPLAAIDGVLVVDPVVHVDDRGLFVETWRQEWLGDVPPMVQGNRADRVAGTVVGLLEVVVKSNHRAGHSVGPVSLDHGRHVS